MPLTSYCLVLLAFVLPLSAFGRAQGDLDLLPEAIRKQAVKGKATLYADFKNAVDGQVKVYLLNPTTDPIVLHSQDGDILSKRESFASDAVWRRCDGHIFSDCGNSYGMRTVPEGEFISWTQQLNSPGGTKAQVRFRLYQAAPNDLVSNEGEATVLAEEIHSCRYDILAMRTAPFEDVAALATGAISLPKDPHQWQDPETSAVEALERFVKSDRVIDTLKLVQERARVAELEASSGNAAKSEDWNRSVHLRRYESALRILGSPMLYTPGDGEVWFHLEGQFRDKTNPWRSTVLRWLINQPYNGGKVIHPLMESVLADPGDEALIVALQGLPKAYTKQQSGSMLKAAIANVGYPAQARRAARDIFESSFANPFIALKLSSGFSSPEGRDPFGGFTSTESLQPFASFTVTNISPQRVRLPCKDLRQLLIIRIALSDGREYSSPAPGPSSSPADEVVLEPGQSIQAGEVRWWELVTLPRPFPDDHFSLSVAFATPGLWELPARDDSSFWLNRKVIEQSAPTSPP